MSDPLVSVICLCYNHERYIAEALLSVLNQTYENIQLIVVDDASTDGSVEIIKKLVGDLDVPLVVNDKNIGNCRSFNRGLALARGEFVIDLAADDVLVKTRVEKGVDEFRTHSSEFGVNFTDAVYIDEYSRETGSHFARDDYGSLNETVPEGDIYSQLLERYFVCTPTMMIKKDVLLEMGGYDESLEFEDFDFWIRSSRIFKYMYTDEILVKKRILQNSMSAGKFSNEKFMESVLKVCLKALTLNQTSLENRALRKRVQYEMRQSMIYGHYRLSAEFYKLYIQLKPGPLKRLFFWILLKMRPNMSFLQKFQG
jgi:glycosyltransferase involved in cell wall biosynthesis